MHRFQNDEHLQKMFMVCLVVAVIILASLTIIQGMFNQDLASRSSDVLNTVIPLDQALINHFDCNELKDWQQQLINDGGQTNYSKSLLEIVNKKMYEHGC